MAKRLRLQHSKAAIPALGLKRVNRLKSTNKTSFSNKSVLDLLETDEYQDIVLDDTEIEELELDDWVILSSSNVKAVKLIKNDKKKSIQVQFGDGSIYEWNTSAELHYNGLISSASAGRYIRNTMYGTHASKIR